MLHIRDLKIGDWVKAEYEGQEFEGQVEQLTLEQVCVRTFDDNLFWYEPKDIDPIPLTEDQLLTFGFVKSDDPDLNGKGQAYVRGPFTLTFVDKNDPKHIMLSYSGDPTRELRDGLTLGQLQHHFHGMTKIILEKMD